MSIRSSTPMVRRKSLNALTVQSWRRELDNVSIPWRKDADNVSIASRCNPFAIRTPPLTPSCSDGSDDEVLRGDDSSSFTGSARPFRRNYAVGRFAPLNIPKRGSSFAAIDSPSEYSPSMCVSTSCYSDDHSDDASQIVDCIFGITRSKPSCDSFHDAEEYNNSSFSDLSRSSFIDTAPTTPESSQTDLSLSAKAEKRPQRIRRKPVPAYDPADFEQLAPVSPRSKPALQLLHVDVPPLVLTSHIPASLQLVDARQSHSAYERGAAFAHKINSLKKQRSQALGWWVHGNATMAAH